MGTLCYGWRAEADAAWGGGSRFHPGQRSGLCSLPPRTSWDIACANQLLNVAPFELPVLQLSTAAWEVLRVVCTCRVVHYMRLTGTAPLQGRSCWTPTARWWPGPPFQRMPTWSRPGEGPPGACPKTAQRWCLLWADGLTTDLATCRPHQQLCPPCPVAGGHLDRSLTAPPLTPSCGPAQTAKCAACCRCCWAVWPSCWMMSLLAPPALGWSAAWRRPSFWSWMCPPSPRSDQLMYESTAVAAARAAHRIALALVSAEHADVTHGTCQWYRGLSRGLGCHAQASAVPAAAHAGIFRAQGRLSWRAGARQTDQVCRHHLVEHKIPAGACTSMS